ncbi:basic juvenile hormone-suppressible protein 1-like [Battus philenor]|uniref:basic juvenile hormone-suppressible protein 1-like n=1 Tax=Battus philenor TaxID=42288 RepID=UPI0035D0E811
MKLVWFAAFVAVATASVVKENVFYIGKDVLVNLDIKTKEVCVMKLLNHILQPTMYDDIREVAREYVLEENFDKYLKVDIVKKFFGMYKMGLLPRGEIFVHSNDLHMKQAAAVFKLLYFAKDFDTFIRTACWLRERINGGMFVYAFTCAIFHRQDCRGVVIPPPYEIYPYFFVDSHIINKAFTMKMTRAAKDPMIQDYYGIKVTDKNLVVIDWRKGVRHVLSEDDKISYFTEDIDLNTYMYYLHMNYPEWMDDDIYGLHKERRGEMMMYAYQQLLARYRLERLTHGMCDIKMIKWDDVVKNGYWPKIRLHTGDEMPVRQNDVKLINKNNYNDYVLLEDIGKVLREGILTGQIIRRDGTTINLRKAEDVEYLCRLILGGMGMQHDDAKVIHVSYLVKKLLTYSVYNVDKYTYVPTAIDMYTTCLRDPVFWTVMKRMYEYVNLFKKLLPNYTRDELDFPGVKIERVVTDDLVTFMDEYDLDITNAVYLDEAEMQKKRADMTYVARMRRLNHHPFKVTIDVVSDKAVDAVVRVFIGPKYDCMGRLISINDKRLDMVEIDSFLYKLDTGKNTIVRNSIDMHGVLTDRPWTRNYFNTDTTTTINSDRVVDNYWYKTRIGFPHRLLLPLGQFGGLPLQFFVIVTPVRTGYVLPTIDQNVMKDRRVCRWTTCVDSMPLGFPFDREIDVTWFFTNNMKFYDVKVYRKDLGLSNTVKNMDRSDMVMKRDDLTYLDTDMLVNWSYKDVMLMSTDKMQRM